MTGPPTDPAARLVLWLLVAILVIVLLGLLLNLADVRFD